MERAKRLQMNASARLKDNTAQGKGRTPTRQGPGDQRRERARGSWAETKGQDPERQEGPQGASARICRVLRFQISTAMLECNLWNTTSVETRLRAMDLLRERKTVNVSWWSPARAPDHRGVGNVLAEKRGKVWAIVSKFGLKPGLRTVIPSLLGVRRQCSRRTEPHAQVK